MLKFNYTCQFYNENLIFPSFFEYTLILIKAIFQEYVVNLFINNLFYFCLAINFICLLLPLLIAVAYLTLFERKIISSIQRRKGPNVVGIGGLLQPLADGLKLFLKEMIFPSVANKILFFIGPLITFFLSLISWCVIPFDFNVVFSDLNLGILYLFAISSLGVYGIIIAGWSSNSKYPFLGALRSAAQMISYEVSIGLILLVIVICVGSFNLTEIVLSQKGIWFCIPLFPTMILFFISMLAETNRAPFDLPEAEAELVSGYNVEYSSMGFALFFLGEYANMILMSALSVTLFFGGWLPIIDIGFFSCIPGYFWFCFKILLVLFFFIWVRSTLPRFRYDQLMTLGWKVFLPLSLANLIICVSILYLFDFFPVVI